MSTLNERDRPSPAPTGEALPEEPIVIETRRKLAHLLALGALRAARRVPVACPTSSPTGKREAKP